MSVKITHLTLCMLFSLSSINTMETVSNFWLVSMVTNFTKTFNHPVSINGAFCNIFDSVTLIKNLSNEGIAASMHLSKVDTAIYSFFQNPTLFVVDLNCNHAFTLFGQANKNKLFALPHRWLLINNDENTILAKSHLSNLNILVDSDVTLADCVTTDHCRLVKVYKLLANRGVLEQEIGFWQVNHGVILTHNTKTFTNRNNLMKITLNTSIVVTMNDSLMHLHDKREKHIDTISKVSYALLQHLGDILNVSLKYSVQNTWGYMDNQSNWNGMIGELQRQEAVIGGTALFLRSERIPVVDYVGMTIPTRSKFVFRQPKLSYVANVYTLPFNWTVWMSLLVTVVLIIVTLYYTIKWDWVKQQFITKEAVWLDVTLLVFGAVCQQGSSFTPSNVSGRIITILMFITLMFLYTAYSANIVALLQSSSNNIQTLSDLLHSRLSMGVDDTVFNRFYFPHATEPIRQAIYQQKVAPAKQKPRYFSIREGVEMMRNEHFAFHMETGVGYQFVLETFQEHEKCALNEIQYLQVADPALAIQKNTPYKKIITIGLRKIHESGLQAREVSALYTKKPLCVNRASSFISVSIIDCYLAASVLFGGIILATVILIFEIILKKYSKDKQ